MISGVIFDMDGLMIDTERLYLNMWTRWMREHGLPEREDVVIHCIGLNHGAMQKYVMEQLGPDFDYSGVMHEIYLRAMQYREENGVPVKPGLYALLDYLDGEQIPYAVATSTHRQDAVKDLQRIGVYDRLQSLIAGDMVTRGKPDPEIFLLASEALKLPPNACMVLEDSPHGILAACRAGCMAVMVPDLKQPDDETKAMLYGCVEQLDQVIPLIQKSRNPEK